MQQAVSHTDFAQQIEDPDFRWLYDHWNNLRGVRFAPTRAQIDPVDLRPVMGDVMLIEVVQDPLRFRFRLHGTNLVERAGYDMTGKFADELPHEENRRWLEDRYHSLVRNRQPEYGQHDRIVADRRWRYEVLWLPLSNGGDNVDQLLGVMRYRDTMATARPIKPSREERLTIGNTKK